MNIQQEGICKADVWEGAQSFHVFSGCTILWHLHTFTSLEALHTPYCWDFVKASSRRRHQLLTPFPAPLLWKSQASNHGLVFLVTSPHPGAHQQLPHQNKDTPITQEIPRDLGVITKEFQAFFRSSVPGTRDRNQCIYFLLFPRSDQEKNVWKDSLVR